MTGHLCSLDMPNQGAGGVLVPNLNRGGGHPVNSLPVDVQPVPGVRVLDVWVRLEDTLLLHSLDRDDQVDSDQTLGKNVWGELQLDGREISLGSRAVVHQSDVTARYV